MNGDVDVVVEGGSVLFQLIGVNLELVVIYLAA